MSSLRKAPEVLRLRGSAGLYPFGHGVRQLVKERVGIGAVYDKLLARLAGARLIRRAQGLCQALLYERALGVRREIERRALRVLYM